ncbi:MAG: hypothetical protein J6V53_03910 [Alphaproteobacteria bacterium]|nr:hypothetical protein [Alphaproteobacteria bacterium]
MKENRGLSSSEQYVKKSNRTLLFGGLFLLIIFFVALSFISDKAPVQNTVEPINWIPEYKTEQEDPSKEVDPFSRGEASLKVVPEQIDMNNVVIGSQVEALIKLTAENGPVLYKGATFLENQQDGFSIETTCGETKSLAVGQECFIKVLWNPVSLRQIQNVLTIQWEEDSAEAAGFSDRTHEKTVQVKAQSTDSKDCVICETVSKDDAQKEPTYAMGLDGKLYPVNEDGSIVIDGEVIKKTENGLYVNKDGKIVAIAIPEKLPLNLKNEIMGKINPNGDVINENGEKIGRLLGDDTIVDSELTVLGAAVPIVSAMDMTGTIIGKLLKDGTIVNEKGAVIGKPLANGAVANLNNRVMGVLTPWGLVADLTGNVIGGIIPDGTVMDASNNVLGTVKPNGLVVNSANELIGGTIPQGVAVAPGCQLTGKIMQNGEVRDSYNQTVGKTLIDGSVIDNAGTDIGGAIPLSLIINEKGQIIGFVNSEGKAVGPQGAIIGCINPDGSVTAGKKPIGAILPKGRVIGFGCQQIGSVFPNGIAINDSGEQVGKVMTDSYVRNDQNRIIGVVVPRASAIADGCRLLGLVTLGGDLTDSNNEPFGCITPDRTVVNNDGKIIGAMAIKGVVKNAEGVIIGRVRLDGKVMDLKGKIIGCLQEDGSVISLDGKEVLGTLVGETGTSGSGGVVLGADGTPTGWSVMGNKVIDQNGNVIGTIDSNGIVSDEKGKFLGVIPPDGVIVSPEGLILGRYNSKIGYGLNQEGEKFARILPNLTAISGETQQIIGTLIPDKTSFLDVDNNYLGTMTVDGTLKNTDGDVIGAIRANGTVTDKDGKVLGFIMPQGTVLSVLGKEIGSVTPKGEVVSPKKTVIGKILANGIAISSDEKIIGGVFKRLSVAFSGEELIGYPSVTGAIMDKNGNIAGQATPFGLVINENDGVIGRMLPFGIYVDTKNELIGWTSFDADLLGKNARSIGRLMTNGIALDKAGTQIGYLVKTGLAVKPNGALLGYMSINNTIQTEKDKGYLYASDFIYNNMDEVVGRVLPQGVAVDNSGKFAGILQSDGRISLGKSVLGYALSDNRIANSKGDITGTFIPLNSVGFTDNNQTTYLINEYGEAIDAKGKIKGLVIAPQTVTKDGNFIARLTDKDLFVSENSAAKTIGLVSTNGSILSLGSSKPVGSVMMNGLTTNLIKQIQGNVLNAGPAVSNALNTVGRESLNGTIFLRGKKESVVAGTRALYNEKDLIRGMTLPVSTFVGKSGLLIGKTQTAAVITNQDEKNIAVQMPLGVALTTDNVWAGGKAPFGVAVDDYAKILGTVAADGAVIGKDNQMTGRALSDGSVAGIRERSLFNTMPQKGGLVQQGLPFSYRGEVLGRTTLSGDILDATDNKTLRILDDGTILGKNEPLAGAVLPFYTAISQEGSFMGTLIHNGQIVLPNGELKGKIAVNGTVKEGTYKITGALIPSYLITNDCKVVGQAAFNGQVIDAKGTVVGRILPNKWAINSAGEKIGRVTRNGIVMSPEGKYIGRTMPDSTVVDTNGINIGCSRNDGTVVDHKTGEVIGATQERGLILGEDGKPKGRVTLDGSVVDINGEKIGTLTADGKVIDENGNVIGWNTGRDKELIFDENGNIKGTFSADGIITNNKGEFIAQVLPTGEIVDANGNRIGELSDNGELPIDIESGLLVDANGNVFGKISGCDVFNLQNEKIATITPNGSIIDLNGEIYATIREDGMLFDKDGQSMGQIKGVDVRLDKCGIKTSASNVWKELSKYLTPEELEKLRQALAEKGLAALEDFLTPEELEKLRQALSAEELESLVSGKGGYGKAGTRRIPFGSKLYEVTPDGSILDDNGIMIGYVQDGRPYSMDGRPLSTTGDEQGRIRPNFADKKMKPTPEQVQQMQELLTKKREGMKAGMSSRGLITPNSKIKAMARKKADANWKSIGVNKIVSSYPVDMSRMILKDKAIPAVLTRSIDSRYSDAPVTAIVERHIYSEKGRNIIIPAGSRLIGTFAGEQGSDKRAAKLEITWQRLIRPDGGAFSFEGKSGDAQGRGGVAAYLDDELVKKFGKPIMTSVVTSAISYMMATNADMYQDQYGNTITSSKTEAANDARENFIESMQTIFDQLVQDSANIPVVIYVPSGTRLTVFPNEDLWLRSEEDDVAEAEEPSMEAQKPDTSSWVDNRTASQKEEEEEVEEEVVEEEDDKTTDETPAADDSKYYQPSDKYHADDKKSSDKEEDNQPIYTGDSVEKQPVKERKVTPVLPKTGSSDKLF